MSGFVLPFAQRSKSASSPPAPPAVKSIWDEFPHDATMAEQEAWFRDRMAEIAEEYENISWRLEALEGKLGEYRAERAAAEERIGVIDGVLAAVEAEIAFNRQHWDDVYERAGQLGLWASARGIEL